MLTCKRCLSMTFVYFLQDCTFITLIGIYHVISILALSNFNLSRSFSSLVLILILSHCCSSIIFFDFLWFRFNMFLDDFIPTSFPILFSVVFYIVFIEYVLPSSALVHPTDWLIIRRITNSWVMGDGVALPRPVTTQ